MVGDSGIISRRQFILTTAAGVAIGLAGYPSFLRAAEEVDLAVICLLYTSPSPRD